MQETTFRLELIGTSMPILVLYRIVIDALSPIVGKTTKVDFAFFLLVFLSLAILLFQAYVVLVMRKVVTLPEEGQTKRIARLDTVNSLVFVAIMITLVTLMTYNTLT